MARTKKKQNPYAQIPNELLNSTFLSLKAKGVYAYMYAKPDNWNFTVKSMSKQLKEGMEAISNAIKELKNNGWCTYEKHQDGTGTYELFETPNTEKPNMGNPNMGKPECISNKDSIQRKINTYDAFIQDLKSKVKHKTKVNKTKLGEQLFKHIEDLPTFINDYIKHQEEKDNFAIRVTAFMEDYGIYKGISNSSNNESGYTF